MSGSAYPRLTMKGYKERAEAVGFVVTCVGYHHHADRIYLERNNDGPVFEIFDGPDPIGLDRVLTAFEHAAKFAAERTKASARVCKCVFGTLDDTIHCPSCHGKGVVFEEQK